MAAKKKSKAASKRATPKAAGKKAVKKASAKKPAGKKAAGKKAAGKKAAAKKAPAKKPVKAPVARKAAPHKPAATKARAITEPTVKRKHVPPQPTITPKERMERQSTPVVDPVAAMTKAARNTLGKNAALRGPDAPPAAARSVPPPIPADAKEEDRREFLRVPYGAWVNVVRDGRQEFCLARDISLGGVFLKANPPPALGVDIQLLLVIENDSTPLELRGVVVRRSESEGGFGVRFTGLDPMSSKRLRELVADTSAALWRPPGGSAQSAP